MNTAQNDESKLKKVIKKQKDKIYHFRRFRYSGNCLKYAIFIDEHNKKECIGKISTSSNEGEELYWPQLKHENLAVFLEKVSINNQCNIFMTFDLDVSLRDLINDKDFNLNEMCFYRKKTYAKNVFEGLSYLHGKCLCLMNLSDDNIFICNRTDNAIIGDFSCLAPARQVKCFECVSPIYSSAPELKPQNIEKCDPIRVEIWASGILFMEIFTRHMVPWALVDYNLFRAPEVLKYIDHEMLKAANLGSSLSVEDVRKFKLFCQCFLKLDPKYRVSSKNASICSFLRQPKCKKCVRMMASNNRKKYKCSSPRKSVKANANNLEFHTVSCTDPATSKNDEVKHDHVMHQYDDPNLKLSCMKENSYSQTDNSLNSNVTTSTGFGSGSNLGKTQMLPRVFSNSFCRCLHICKNCLENKANWSHDQRKTNAKSISETILPIINENKNSLLQQQSKMSSGTNKQRKKNDVTLFENEYDNNETKNTQKTRRRLVSPFVCKKTENLRTSKPATNKNSMSSDKTVANRKPAKENHAETNNCVKMSNALLNSPFVTEDITFIDHNHGNISKLKSNKENRTSLIPIPSVKSSQSGSYDLNSSAPDEKKHFHQIHVESFESIDPPPSEASIKYPESELRNLNIDQNTELEQSKSDFSAASYELRLPKLSGNSLEVEEASEKNSILGQQVSCSDKTSDGLQNEDAECNIVHYKPISVNSNFGSTSLNITNFMPKKLWMEKFAHDKDNSVDRLGRKFPHQSYFSYGKLHLADPVNESTSSETKMQSIRDKLIDNNIRHSLRKRNTNCIQDMSYKTPNNFHTKYQNKLSMDCSVPEIEHQNKIIVPRSFVDPVKASVFSDGISDRISVKNENLVGMGSNVSSEIGQSACSQNCSYFEKQYQNSLTESDNDGNTSQAKHPNTSGSRAFSQIRHNVCCACARQQPQNYPSQRDNPCSTSQAKHLNIKKENSNSCQQRKIKRRITNLWPMQRKLRLWKKNKSRKVAEKASFANKSSDCKNWRGRLIYSPKLGTNQKSNAIQDNVQPNNSNFSSNVAETAAKEPKTKKCKAHPVYQCLFGCLSHRCPNAASKLTLMPNSEFTPVNTCFYM